MGSWQIENKDVMTWCKEYTGKPFHAMVCDPPYHLTNRVFATLQCKDCKRVLMGSDFPTDTCPRCGSGNLERTRGSKSGGFMGKAWDGGGIAFDHGTWAALSEHLLPGAFIMAFASTRGWHRMACAMEDAGLVMQPSIFVNGTLREVPMMFGWLNGQSFPKASRIDTKLDQAAGKSEERKIVTRPIAYPDSDCWGVPNRNIGSTTHIWGRGQDRPERGQGGVVEHTEAVTPLARTWEGHRYGGQILKNCLEPVICAQKPWEGKRLDCIVETGAGSLWIDGGRVGVNDNEPNFRGDRGLGRSFGGFQYPYVGGLDEEPIEDYHQHSGRWPPNFALCHVSPSLCATCDGDGCDKCNDTGLVGGCRRVGTKRVKGTGIAVKRNLPSSGALQSIDYKARTQRGDDTTYADADGYEETEAWDCVEECAARRIGEQSGERKSCGVYCKMDDWKTTGRAMFGPGDSIARDQMNRYGGETGTCARFFPQFGWAAEMAERLAAADQVRYCAKASRGEREAGLGATPETTRQMFASSGRTQIAGEWTETHSEPLPRRNIHSTVKPIALCRWLATLLLPPPEYAPRRILVPFCGVASEMIAASLAGWEFVQGIEMSEEYCAIGEARLKFWSQFNSYEEAMDAARNIQQAHRKRDAQVQNGQLKLSL